MNKTLLKTIGILNLIFGIILTLTIIGCIIGIPLIVSGAIFLDYSSLDESKLLEKKDAIKVWSIVFIFINIISSNPMSFTVSNISIIRHFIKITIIITLIN